MENIFFYIRDRIDLTTFLRRAEGVNGQGFMSGLGGSVISFAICDQCMKMDKPITLSLSSCRVSLRKVLRVSRVNFQLFTSRLIKIVILKFCYQGNQGKKRTQIMHLTDQKNDGSFLLLKDFCKKISKALPVIISISLMLNTAKYLHSHTKLTRIEGI